MPTRVIDASETLDAATAAALKSRREKLARIAAGSGASAVRMRVAYACAAIVAVCAVAALLAGDRFAAEILGVEAVLVTGFVFVATKAARAKALRELKAMQPPT